MNKLLDDFKYTKKRSIAYKERQDFLKRNHLNNRRIFSYNKKDVLFVPTSSIKGLHSYEGGVFEESIDKPIDIAFQRDGLKRIDEFKKLDCESIERKTGKYVYLGQIRNHWGSFLVDSIARLWFCIDNPKEFKYIYMITQPELGIEMHKNIYRFLELFGIDRHQITILTKPTIVEEVIIPELSYVPNHYYTKEFLGIIDKVVSNVKPSKICRDNIYFSRSKFTSKSKSDFGEVSLVQLAKANNFDIIFPEDCTLDEQINYVNECKTFCTVGGSLAHNILFARRHTPKMIIFNRMGDYQWHQWMINEMVGVDYTYIDAFSEPYRWIMKTTISGPFLFRINKRVKTFIKDFHWKRSRKGNKTVSSFFGYTARFFRVLLSSIKHKVLKSAK